ncbi:CARDB domain-containing protein [Haloterrigena salifodinae]|uniref:CARDB domain-containing protein n=1 Tax=Haloterrigena salifodinae TaxID=2675099 RepID=UPI000F863D14|nr:CARDB domain-containing protein [Haloterrigena salifodinae]
MLSTDVLLTAVAACVLLVFVVPTVAITVGENSAANDVHLEPTSQYATIQDNQLELDLEELNKDAITTADVFTIAITDTDVQRVWIENDVEGLEFYAGNDPTAEIARAIPIEPSAGETIHVGVAVDTHVTHTGTETFTVHVRYDDGEDDEDEEDDENETPQGVTLESLAVSPTNLEAGESVTVEGTYRNENDTAKRHTAKLTVDGTVIDSRTVEIESGETRTVSFERVMQWPGDYDVGLDGAASERVTVTGSGAEIGDASVADIELTKGDRTTISATVENPTNEPVERTLELAVDGIVVDTRTVIVQPGTERTVTFERQFDAPGTYDLAISGVDAGSVTVSEPEPFPIRNRQLSAATTAALAPPLTMGILFLGAAANRRWAIVSSEY